MLECPDELCMLSLVRDRQYWCLMIAQLIIALCKHIAPDTFQPVHTERDGLEPHMLTRLD